MRVFYYDWPCFGGEAIKRLFADRGIEATCFAHPKYDQRNCPELEEEILKALGGAEYDLAFSYNFYPSLAECCHKLNVKYIAVVYDSPYVNLYSYKVSYPTNYIFHFDSAEVEKFNRGGIKNVYHITLPTDPVGFERTIQEQHSKGVEALTDVSFVGSLYDEEHNFYDRFRGLDPKTLGYLEGIMAAQSRLYGCSILEECLTPEILEKLGEVVPYEPYADSIEKKSYIYADYFLARKLTSKERYSLLSAVGQNFGLELYTRNRNTVIPGAVNRGVAEYSTKCPLVFADSRINLNITLRSIKNGIPLRCMDIMACGGFLLTNYQFDFEGVFRPGVHYDYFESEKDLIRKIEYYLSHEEERRQIAARGQALVQEMYSIEVVWDRLVEMVIEKMTLKDELKG